MSDNELILKALISGAAGWKPSPLNPVKRGELEIGEALYSANLQDGLPQLSRTIRIALRGALNERGLL